MSSFANLKEELLHYSWKMKNFNLQELSTHSGQSISIINFGVHNHDAGPDFLEAKIKIGNATWVGNVEMHLKSSDWNLHKHQFDPAYNNVILHVVFHHDKEVTNSYGTQLEVLELKERIPFSLIYKFDQLIKSESWIPCESQLHIIDKSRFVMFVQSLAIERLEQKSEVILKEFTDSKNDWELVFYKWLMRYFGFKVNASGFERLSRCIPYKLVKKYSFDSNKLAALFFGQAGFLERMDGYSCMLLKEYDFLKHKYGLQKMQLSEWKYLRLRPANFPTIRIAQLVALFANKKNLISCLMQIKNIEEAYALLECKTDIYWDTHYKFGKSSKLKKKRLGKKSIDILVINVVVPLLFCRGKFMSDEVKVESAVQLMEQVSPETNSISNRWKSMGFDVKSGLQSQGLIQLKKNYCESYRCLECQIGNRILSF